MENTSSKKLKLRDVLYYRQRQKNIVFEKLASFFEGEAKRRGITKKDVAMALDKDPSQITRWLSSPSNITLDTISDMLLALDAIMDFEVQRFSDAPKQNYIHETVQKVLDATSTKLSGNPVTKTGSQSKLVETSSNHIKSRTNANSKIICLEDAL